MNILYNIACPKYANRQKYVETMHKTSFKQLRSVTAAQLSQQFFCKNMPSIFHETSQKNYVEREVNLLTKVADSRSSFLACNFTDVIYIRLLKSLLRSERTRGRQHTKFVYEKESISNHCYSEQIRAKFGTATCSLPVTKHHTCRMLAFRKMYFSYSASCKNNSLNLKKGILLQSKQRLKVKSQIHEVFTYQVT